MAEIWDRQQDEPGIWYSRFVLYRNLGPARSLLGAVNKANKSKQKHIESIPGAWSANATTWQWKARAEAYDAAIHAEKERNASILREIEADEERRILLEDYAAKHKRVAALVTMAHVIEKSFIREDGTVDYKFMSPDKIKEWRGILDDIAKEVGHRVKETRLTGKDGGPVIIDTVWGNGSSEES